MKLGIMLPIGGGAMGEGRTARWAELREIGRLAEAVGFDTIFVPDHLLFRRSPPDNVTRVTMPEGRTRGIWEGWTILSALAEATERIHIGPLVACTSFRNPAIFAKMADTLDEVSDGRLVLGLGAGWHEPEYDAFGLPFDYLVSRFEEALQIIVPLLRDGHVDFQGRYYQARDCELAPRGPRPGGPPILIGAQRPRMLRLAARYADIYDAGYQLDPADLSAPLEALDEACAAVGRAPEAIERWAGTRVALDLPGETVPAQVDAAAGEGIVVFEWGDMHMPTRLGTPEEIEADARRFEAAGAKHLTLWVVHPTGVSGIERLAPVVERLHRQVG